MQTRLQPTSARLVEALKLFKEGYKVMGETFEILANASERELLDVVEVLPASEQALCVVSVLSPPRFLSKTMYQLGKAQAYD